MLPAVSNRPSLQTAAKANGKRAVRLPLLFSKAMQAGLGRGVWALFDQGVISLANLVSMIVLARALGPGTFGTFTLAYLFILIAGSVQSSLVTQPYNILGAIRDGEVGSRYTTGTAIGQVGLAVALTAAVLVAGFIGSVRGWDWATLLYVLAPTIFAWQLQEFVRRVLYTKRRISAALLNDVISFGGQTAVLLALWQTGTLTLTSAMAVLAITSAIATVVGVVQIRTYLGGSPQSEHIAQANAENWQHGKWLAGGQVGYWLSTQAYVFLAAALLTTAASGAIRASQTLLGPLVVLSGPIDSLLPARFSRAFEAGGKYGLHQSVKFSYLLTFPFVSAYCVVVAVFAEPILDLTFGSDYDGYANVVRLLCLYHFAGYGGRIAAIALRAKGLTRPIFTAYTVSSVLSLAVGWLIISLGGIEGAAAGMVATNVILGAIVWRAYAASQSTNVTSPQ